MADSILSDLISKLGSAGVRNLGVWWNYKDELQKLEDSVETIQAVLEDAEEELQPSNQFKLWLRKLKNVLFDAEELVDDFSTELLRRQVMTGSNMTKEARLFFSWSSNQFVYGLRMGYKIKTVREALDDIANDRQKFHFTVSSTKTSAINKIKWTDSAILLNHDKVKGEILGREDDKREIIGKYLLREDGEMVISIVGSGGLGKTTLAKWIYEDNKVKEHFDLRMWVSVGDVSLNVDDIVEKAVKSTVEKEKSDNIVDDNVEKAMKSTVEKDNIVGRKVEGEAVRRIEKSKSFFKAEDRGDKKETFKKLIQNKKILLVLDDVWSENRNEWIDLEKLWKDVCGTESRIMITTRSSNVAKMTGNGEPYRLGYLSHEHSKSLFKKIVFGNKEVHQKQSDVEKNVEKIVEKCGGVPLALKTIGNLLYFLNPETEWLPYVTTEISKYPQANNNVFPTLELSYHHLSSPLKYCFAYCKIFPKGYEIEVETLIQLWIAHGYIRAPNMSDQNLEDIGMQYCKMLLAMCFFQDEKLNVFGKIESLKMHDIMHELISYVGGGDIVHSDPLGSDVNKNTHHLSCNGEISWPLSQHFDSLLEARKLRTFIALKFEGWKFSNKYMIETRQCNKMLKKMKSLFVLDLHEPMSDDPHEWLLKVSRPFLHQDQVLRSISKLKHLRYLDLSHTNIKKFPNSITKLQNLRVLKIAWCIKLRKLPKNIKKLVNLQILDCEDCEKLEYMPCGLQKLTSLHTLTRFAVGKGQGFLKSKAGLEELNSLSMLKKLKIVILKNVKNDLSTSEGVNLKLKKHLLSLSLSWGDSVGADYSENTLQKLEPPSCLQELAIDFYEGMRFPEWFLTLEKLVVLEFANCKNCEYLPPLSQLRCLKSLSLWECDKLRYVEYEKSKDGTFYPSLKELEIFRCECLEQWWKSDETKTMQTTIFPCLSTLRVSRCPKLTSMPLFPDLGEELMLKQSSMKPLLQTLTMASTTVDQPLSKLKNLEIGIYGVAPGEEITEDLGSILERMQQFSSLHTLELRGSYLEEKCGNKEAAEWRRIKDIPNITVGWKIVKKEGRYQLDDVN